MQTSRIKDAVKVLKEAQDELAKASPADVNSAYYAIGATEALIRMALRDLEGK